MVVACEPPPACTVTKQPEAGSSDGTGSNVPSAAQLAQLEALLGRLESLSLAPSRTERNLFESLGDAWSLNVRKITILLQGDAQDDAAALLEALVARLETLSDNVR